MSLFKSVKVINSGKAVLVTRKDGSSLRYHSTWLRDNANDPKTIDKNNGQRLFLYPIYQSTLILNLLHLIKKVKI